MKVAEAWVELRPKSDNFQRDADHQLAGPLKGIAKGAAAAFAAVKVKDFLGGAINEAEEAAKVTAQTAAAIKSMGGVANVTAKEVAGLAESISAKTAIDDEAIQSASNLLLTFGQIRNEVGKGNDIFNQATQAAVDMSVALGTDAKGAALQVGKALNDPLKGITALTRAGVSFTQQQKDQIKAMVASGDTIGAQKLILSELTKQFGGSAAAQATASDKMRVGWANLKETLGTALLPVVKFVTDAFTTLLPVIEPYLPLLLGVAAAVGALVAVTKIYTAVQTALNVVLSANPIALVVLAIAGLVAGLVIAYQKSETFRNIVKGAFDAVANAAGWVKERLGDMVSFITGMPGKIASAARGMWDGITKAFKSAINAIIRGWNGIQFKIPGFKVGPVGYDGFTLGVPDIPLLHSGGIFRAPGGAREGLALLEDGERVIPRGQSGAERSYVIHLHNYLDGREVATAIVDPMAKALDRRDAALSGREFGL